MTKVKKQEKLKPVYLIGGDDTPKVAQALSRLKARVIDEAGSDINIDIFDALDHGAAAVIRAADTLPFGEGVRLVIVMNIGAWQKGDKDDMAGYLADPAPYSCVALVGKGIKKNEKLYGAVEAAGLALIYDAPRAADLPAWTQQQAAARRLKLGTPEARRLVKLAGDDQMAIINEIEKLAAYAGQGKCEIEDIEAICWVSSEVRIWDLTDALGKRNRPAVFENLERLFDERHAPAAIFFSLARHIRILLAVASARERGEEPLKAAATLGLKPYAAKKIAGQSTNFTLAALKKALQILSDLDADIKGRQSLRADFALEAALARILDQE